MAEISEAHNDHILKGVFLACAAFFLFTLMQALSKSLTGRHDVIEIAFYRNLVAFIPCSLYVLISRRYELLKVQAPLKITIRLLTGAVGIIATFSAIERLPMSNATVLFFVSTLIIPVLAHFFLKEKIGPHRWAAVIVGMTGAFLVAQPSAYAPILGILIALAAAFFQAVAQVILRAMRSESPFTITYYFFLGGVLFSGAFMPWVAHWPDLHSAAILLGIGVTGGLGQYCLTLAFRLAPASLLSPFNYTGLIWATGLDILVWHYVPGWPVFIGGAIIIGSNLYILHRERLKGKRQKFSAAQLPPL